MQRELFSQGERDGKSNSVTEYLQKTIKERFPVAGVPDAFLYFPEDLGGLGVRNPFISFLVVREQLLKNPKSRMTDFLKVERNAYKAAKKKFDAMNERERSHRLESILGKLDKSSQFTPISYFVDSTQRQGPSWTGPTGTEFLTFDEFTQYRETSSEEMRAAYNALLVTPYKVDAQPSREVAGELSSLSARQPEVSWNRLGSDRKWLIQLYSKEAFERFGGLGIVNQELMPMGVMTSLRKRKVTWQTVL